MMYAQNGLAVNEFLGHKWRHVSKRLSDLCRQNVQN